MSLRVPAVTRQAKVEAEALAAPRGSATNMLPKAAVEPALVAATNQPSAVAAAGKPYEAAVRRKGSRRPSGGVSLHATIIALWLPSLHISALPDRLMNKAKAIRAMDLC